MKPRLVPLYFHAGRDAEFDQQTAALSRLLAQEAEILPPVALGAPLPEAEAVVFPQMLGEAYRMGPAFQALNLPILVITSEFGTVSMWDWEICAYLKTIGVESIAPYNLAQTQIICRALALKRRMQDKTHPVKFLAFQDNPGDGFQASIFKRFYWWEPECIQRLQDKFGLEVVKKSFQTLGAAAKAIPDVQAEAAWDAWQDYPLGDISRRALLSAVKLYLAVKQELAADPSIEAVGINCLNESHFSDTTPCLAWAMLHEEVGLTWGCEADLVSMLTMYILHGSIQAPMMMTNLYPFLMGQAALKHERISHFPEVADKNHPSDPENHLLVAHCGYLGVLPRIYAAPAQPGAAESREWVLRPKVLAIVDQNATAIDARLPTGKMTLVKLMPSFDKMAVVQGQLENYVQYPGSDCLNGGVIQVTDGPRLMESLASHHYILTSGHHQADIALVGKILGFGVETY